MHNPLIHPTLLHPLTGEPLRAAGIVNGRVIWPIMGASEDSGDANDGGSDDGGDGDADKDSGTDDGDKDAGGDGDKDGDGDAAGRMLIDERNGRKTAESLLAELTGKSKTEVRKLLRGGAAAAREALVPAKKDDKKDGDQDAPDADAIRREADRAAEERVNARIVRAEVKALAADSFADPADAHLYLDLTDFDVDDDGDVDEAEIKKALADVLRKKPHLAKKGKAPKSDPSQGSRGGSKPDPGTGVNRMRAAYANSAKK